MTTRVTQRRPITGYGDLPVVSTSPIKKSEAFQPKKGNGKQQQQHVIAPKGKGSNGRGDDEFYAPKGKSYKGGNWVLKLIGLNIALILGFVVYQKWKMRGISQMRPIYQFLGNAPRALDEDYIVIVSAATGKPFQTHVRVGRSNLTATDALRRASNRLPLHHSYPYMKIDYVTGMKRFQEFDYFEPFDEDAVGAWYGIALNWTDGMVFLPDQVRAHSMVDRAGYLRWERIINWMNQRFPSKMLSVLPDFSDDVSELPAIDLFHTNSIFVDLTGPYPQAIPLFQGHRRFDPKELTPHTLRQAAVGVGKYLMQHTPEGVMASYYQPRSDIEEGTYMPQMWQGHAAAIQSLANLYSTWKDNSLLKSLNVLLSFLVDKVKPCKIPYAHGNGKCIELEDEQRKPMSLLGLNSMLLLALADYIDATAGDRRYASLATELAKWIAGCQPDSGVTQKPHGSFAQKVIFDPPGVVDEFTEMYAESLAVFSLARFVNVMESYHYSYRQEWKEVAYIGIKYLVEEARAFKDDYANDPFLLHAIADLTKFHDADLQPMLEYSIKCSQLIAKYQVSKSEKRPDYVGSMVDDPSVTTSAALSDGLCAVFKTLLLHDRKDEAHSVLDGAVLSVAYQLQSQYQPETAMYMANPDRILGGMHQSTEHLDMAIYDSQYNLNSFLCVAGALEYKAKSRITW